MKNSRTSLHAEAMSKFKAAQKNDAESRSAAFGIGSLSV